MSLDSIVKHTITKEDASLTQAGFGTVCIAGYHTVWVGPELTREYDADGGLEAMVTDGFATTDPLYLAAQAYLSNNPRSSGFKIGKLGSAPVWTTQITPVNITEGFVYDFDVVHAGVTTNITYTVQNSDTVALIVDALVSQITAITGVTATDDITHATVTTDNIGALAAVVSTHDHADLQVENVTADPGIATDLSAIEAADDEWYGLLLASNSPAEVLAAMAWAEARTKLFGATASDSECKSASVTDDVISTAQASSYFRSFILWSENDLDYAAATLMGEEFPFQPGSRTWEYKTLSGVVVSNLKAAERSALIAKNAVIYVTVAGRNVTRNSKTPGGEWIDVTHGIDELHARVQERVFATLVANGKVPYTKAGASLIQSPVQAVLDERADPAIGFIAPEPAPAVTVPDVSKVAKATKQARTLPDVRWSATLAGAIHATEISGQLSV
ncbi:MAG: DUF3383 domain-containing protein [Gammaproteobacteria bacterium]|nr:DUF3383 domain-containing protein [Gammaproteobacteria bacterium]NIR85145.1 DUF3383 domain-containing protein [Gammaproteobacteria bacterium]NIU06194.1 DUF3383 domain-containing protein [Gammaproteobacteria bacterium]NIX87467.1 DUF3383 family protein [Gammaproteobacteria bacterium]